MIEGFSGFNKGKVKQGDNIVLQNSESGVAGCDGLISEEVFGCGGPCSFLFIMRFIFLSMPCPFHLVSSVTQASESSKSSVWH